MSESELPEGFEKAKELSEKAEEMDNERKEEFREVLEASAEKEEALLEETEWTDIGGIELKVSTSVPGKVYQKVQAFRNEAAKGGGDLDTIIDVFVDQTECVKVSDSNTWTKDTDIREYYEWLLYEHDIESAGELAFQRVIEEPTELEQKRRGEVVNGFRPDGPRPSDRGASE